MAPSPRKSTPAFDSTWHETDINFLNPTALPLPKIPRAWERIPKSPFARDGKYKKVWRRYELRSQPMDKQSKATSKSKEEQERSRSPVRAVKKLRLKPGESAESVPIWEAKKPAFTATRWDRRKSVLPRKKPSHTNDNHEDFELATELDQNEISGAEDSLVLLPDVVSDTEDGDSSHNSSTEAIEAQISTITDLHDGSAEFSSSNQEMEESLECPQEEPTFSGATLSSGPDSMSVETTFHILDDTLAEDDAKVEDALGSSKVQEEEATAQNKEGSPLSPLSQVSQSDSTDSFVAHKTAKTGITSEEHALDRSEPNIERSILNDSINGDDGIEQVAREVSEEITDNIEYESEETFDSSKPNFELEPKVDGNADADMFEVKELAQGISSLQGAEMSEAMFAQHSDSSTEENDTELTHESEMGEDVETAALFEQPAVSVESVEEEIEDQKKSELVFRGSESPTRGDSLSKAEVNEPVIEQASEKDIGSSVMPVSPKSGSEQLSDNPQYATGSESIADGLTLQSAIVAESAFIPITENATRKLRSPSPPALEAAQEDITTHLDDDTAILKDFLTRAAASKANKANIATTIARRTSLSHRRDSDAIRHALASPRKILEDKDPNSPSPPISYDATTTIDLSESLTLQQRTLNPSDDHESTGVEAAKPPTTSRRSTRSRSSRIPHPPPSHNPQPQTPNRIPVRRADGGEPVVLRRTEAQELGILTRANTRKNKGGAVAASVRLLKLVAEEAVAASSIVDEVFEVGRDGAAAGERKAVRWDETLAYFQHKTRIASPSADALADLAGATAQVKGDVEMLDSGVEEPASLEAGIAITKSKSKSKSKDKATGTPRIRRLRGLGAANGTPGKGLLVRESLLPAEVLEEKEKAVTEVSRLAKPTRAKKLPVASEMVSLPEVNSLKLEQEVPAKVDKEVKERKSRLATPRKVKIPVSTTPALPLDGKENSLIAGTPKKGVGIAVGVEAGLPRRRGAKRL